MQNQARNKENVMPDKNQKSGEDEEKNKCKEIENTFKGELKEKSEVKGLREGCVEAVDHGEGVTAVQLSHEFSKSHMTSSHMLLDSVYTPHTALQQTHTP